MCFIRYTNPYPYHVIVNLQSAVKRLQRSLLAETSWTLQHYNEENLESSNVPSDVKEGHFAVLAMNRKVPRRFVVPLSYLSHPTFLSLLDQAAEEHGFQCNSALSIPCHRSVIEKILG